MEGCRRTIRNSSSSQKNYFDSPLQMFRFYLQHSFLSWRKIYLLNVRMFIYLPGGGEKAKQRHLSRNKLLPRDRISSVLDIG